jgi:hypothetical protein
VSTIQTADPPPICPRCGLPDHLHLVSHVVATHRGRLAWDLAAPQPPGARSARGTGAGRPGRARRIVLWVLLALLPLDLFLIFVFVAFALAAGVLLGAAALVGLAGYLVYRVVDRSAIARRRAEEAARPRRYQHALGYWYQLQFCARCQGVFLPGHAWQHPEVMAAGALAAPTQAWRLAQELAAFADRFHAARDFPKP